MKHPSFLSGKRIRINVRIQRADETWGTLVKREADVRKTQVIIRGWCFVAISLYLVVLLVFLAILIGQDSLHQPQPSWWQNAIGPAVLVVQLSALSLFAWGLTVWSSSLAWRVRLSAWLILFAGLVPMVSFSVYLAPLLMMTMPVLWPWHRVSKQIES